MKIYRECKSEFTVIQLSLPNRISLESVIKYDQGVCINGLKYTYSQTTLLEEDLSLKNYIYRKN